MPRANYFTELTTIMPKIFRQLYLPVLLKNHVSVVEIFSP